MGHSTLTESGAYHIVLSIPSVLTLILVQACESSEGLGEGGGGGCGCGYYRVEIPSTSDATLHQHTACYVCPLYVF